MKITLSLLVLMLAGALLVLALAACSSGGEDKPEGRWLSLLSLIPDTELTRREVTMNDYAQVRELFGIDQPAADVDEEGLGNYIEALFTATDGIWPARLLIDSIRIPGALMDLRTELGFTIADADVDIFAGGTLLPTDQQPGNQEAVYLVVRGRISKQTVEQALRTDPSFSDLLEEASHGGVGYYHWGYEGVDVSRATSIRPLGQGRQLFLGDDTLSWTKFVEDMENMIDAASDALPSLADSEDYQLVANALDDMGTFSASLSSDTTQFLAATWEGRDATFDDLVPELALVPYTLVATGRGLDGDRLFTAVVLVHDDETNAAENVMRLRRRIDEVRVIYVGGESTGEVPPIWSEMFSDVRIEREGRLVLARLYGDQPSGLWQGIAFESLLIHE